MRHLVIVIVLVLIAFGATNSTNAAESEPDELVRGQDVSHNEELKNAIIEFFNQLDIRKVVRENMAGTPSPIEMETIYEMNISDVIGDVTNIKIKYRWKMPDQSQGKTENGLATIQRGVSSFKVLKFATGGITYPAPVD